MTTSRPDDYRKCPSMKERSSRDNVYSYIFQLQTEALRALPESGAERPLYIAKGLPKSSCMLRGSALNC
jgi:hypothetical protein